MDYILGEIVFGNAYDFIYNGFDLHATSEERNCLLNLYYIP